MKIEITRTEFVSILRKRSLKKLLFFTLLMILGSSLQHASAQTCSVNAGVPSSVCVSAGSFMLVGNATGALSATASWSLVSGPNIPSITSPSSPSTAVTGIISGTYIFRYSSTCSDAAVVSDSVTVTVNAMPVFTAGRDTFVCGYAVNTTATLPSGATGAWTYAALAGSGAMQIAFTSPASPVSTASVTSYNEACPKPINAIWTVTQGTCIVNDTAVLSYGTESSLPTTPDKSLCGTSSYSQFYYMGCGGNVAATQISGPSTATIGYYLPGTVSYNRVDFSSMITGDYIFAVSITRCSGTTFLDTFKVTISSTIAVSNPTMPGKNLCPEQFDSVYYFEPLYPLLPGETLTWNLVPTTKHPGALPNPIADTIGNLLRIRNVLHPDTTTADAYNYYVYDYSVSNGVCVVNYQTQLLLFSPLSIKAFQPVLNLGCGETLANIAQVVSGVSTSYGFNNIKVILKPAGAPAPAYQNTSSGSIDVTNLKPGKYVFTFDYWRNGNSSCDVKSATVEVNVGAMGGLSNAGTDQILPCGVDSSTLAGNVPLAGQTGTWTLVSGPSSVLLTNPNSPSLVIKTLLPGAYTFRWSINNGIICPGTSDLMSVIVTPVPPSSYAGADKTTCYGYAIPLTGSAFGLGTSGRWRMISGPAVTILDSTSAVTSLSGTIASSVYTLTYTVTNSCGSAIDTIVISTGASQGPSNAVITTADQCLTTGSTTLTAVAASIGIGGWSQLSGPSAATIVAPASNSTFVSGLIGGEYKFIWQVTAAGCDTLRDTASVAYRTGLITANAGPDRYVCKDSIHLNASLPTVGTGIWSQTGGVLTTISDSYSPTASVTGMAGGGIYDYKWTVNLGSCPAVSDDVHVVISSPPSIAKAMNDSTICGLSIGAGGQIILPLKADSATAGIGSWLIIDAPIGYASTAGIASSGSYNTTIAMIGGHYILQWQVSNGSCATSKDTVVIDLVPKADAGVEIIILCEKVSQEMRGTDPGIGTVLWSQISGPSTATITDPSSVFTTIINLLSGVYKFKYEVTHPTTGCSSYDTITINNGVKIIANAGRDSVFCWKAGSTTLFLKADTPSAGTGVWARTSGTGTLSYSPGSTSNPTNATVTQPGLHQFSWTVTNGGCQTIDYKDILVEKITVPAIAFNAHTACKDSFAVSVVSPFSNFNYAWSFPKGRIKDTSGINLTGPLSNNFLISDTNSIYLTITNPVSGCNAKDSIAVIVDCSYLPLPLQLLSFDAVRTGQSVKLEWKSTNEKGILIYHIQRSADGKIWKTLGALEANNRDLLSYYKFIDIAPLSGTNLYRLAVEEENKNYSYSPVRFVKMDGSVQGILIYPNPASSKLQIVLEGTGSNVTYSIVDQLGRNSMEGSLIENANNSVDISNIATGVYLLKITVDGMNTVHQINIIK